MKIRGALTLTSPLQVVLPSGAARLSSTTGRVVYSDEPGTFPLTQTSKLPLHVAGERVLVPVVPANTLRGGLRRAAADLILESFRARGLRITMSTWQGLRAGAVHGHPDGADPSIEEAMAAANDPYLGLFGGSARMVPSRVRIDTGWPVVSQLVEAGIIPPGADGSVLTHLPEKGWASQLLGYQWCRRGDDALMVGNATRLNDVLSDPVAVVDAWRQLFGSSAEKGDTGIIGLRALTAIEFIVPGVSVAFNAELSGATPEQGGLFLLALRAYCRAQKIGAATRHGFGRFTPVLTVSGVDGAQSLPCPLFGTETGEVEFSSLASAALADVLAAGERAVQVVEPATLEALFAPSENAFNALRRRAKGSEDDFDKVFK